MIERNRPAALAAALVLAVSLAVALPLLPTAQAQTSFQVSLSEFLFDPSTLQVAPGENVTIQLANDGAIVHTFTIFEEANADVPLDDNEMLQEFYANNPTLVDYSLEAGEERTIQFDAPDTPGTYVLVCMEAGHAESGMVGQLVVGEPGDGGLDPVVLGVVVGVVAVVVVGAAFFLLRRRQA